MNAQRKPGAKYWLARVFVLAVIIVLAHLAWRLGYYGEIH